MPETRVHIFVTIILGTYKQLCYYLIIRKNRLSLKVAPKSCFSVSENTTFLKYSS